MIAYLKGRLEYKRNGCLIINAGNVGYQVFAGAEWQSKLADGSEVEAYIYHHIREDADDLFGFATLDELEFFEKLISISGIGPKTAVNILSLTELDKLKQAIIKKDLMFLTKISGIGKKTAERMILELEGKLYTADGQEYSPTSSSEVEVMEALVSLGYSQEQARRALKDVDPALESTDAKLKAALRLLSK